VSKRQKLVDAVPIAAAAIRVGLRPQGRLVEALEGSAVGLLPRARAPDVKPELSSRLSAAPQLLALMPPPLPPPPPPPPLPLMTAEEGLEARLRGQEQELESEESDDEGQPWP
jgi:hypothetical protein